MAVGVIALRRIASAGTERTFPKIGLGTGDTSFVAITTSLKLSSSRNSTPPQRMHVFRGFAWASDITIPHEHSRTAMHHTPVLSARES
jgi:hypothetical protein